ncbi:MAG: heavy metal translocating P-type ATPase [Anaerolineaceae bacterium]|nr:heavy metal translocating P-type ATPase [Anaerolineaceae bacterium]
MPQQTYTIGGMDCANCAREVETGVSKLTGVRLARVDFATGKLVLDGDVPFETLKARVEALGKTIEDKPGKKAAPVVASRTRGGVIGFWDYLWARHETRLALAGGGLILLTLVASLLFPLPSGLVSVAYTLAMVLAVYPIARNGVNTLFINREFNINLLMTIAAVGAVVIGEHLEAATVIFLFAVGEALEGYTADRARDSLRQLVALAPATAIRLSDGSESVVAVDDLVVGDMILVKPGERVAMDGRITSGESAVNQSAITGESMPVYKGVDDEVFAGTVNGDGTLHVAVTRLAADNTLSRIIQLVEEAQSVRAPSQRMVDRFAHYYTPAVVVIALLVALVPPLLFGAPFYDTADSHGWFYRALALLVISCPCALVISTPVTIISAITAAARRGVLVKGGAHLEALGRVRAFAFDKTGTLTQGRPEVMLLRSVACVTDHFTPSAPGTHEYVPTCEPCDDMLALAAAVESRSTHPLAQAILAEAREHGLAERYAPAEGVQTLAGRGVQGQVNGKTVTVGSHTLFDLEHPHSAELCVLIDAAEAQGQTAAMISDGDKVHGFVAIADKARDDSAAVIHTLQTLGLHTVMLTGDNAAVAGVIGAEVGVDAVRAGLLPAEKVDAVRDLLAEYGAVAMVGDGINDTPALATATVGIAMGGAGSAQALETADIALMADDLAQLPYAVRLARFARSLIRQNITLSFGMKLGFMVLAIAGGASLWMAVFADVGMSLIVTLNGMRPLRMG